MSAIDRHEQIQILIDQMITLNLLERNSESIGSQINEMLGWNEEAINAMGRVLAKEIATV